MRSARTAHELERFVGTPSGAGRQDPVNAVAVASVSAEGPPASQVAREFVLARQQNMRTDVTLAAIQAWLHQESITHVACRSAGALAGALAGANSRCDSETPRSRPNRARARLPAGRPLRPKTGRGSGRRRHSRHGGVCTGASSPCPRRPGADHRGDRSSPALRPGSGPAVGAVRACRRADTRLLSGGSARNLAGSDRHASAVRTCIT